MSVTETKDYPLEDRVALLAGRDMWSTPAAAGVPSMVLVDGPHGVRFPAGDESGFITGSRPATCFPPAVALGSTWDPGIVRSVGEALGVEARAAGVSVLLGPGVNIKRSPLCGRNFEYFSEDPLVSGVLASSYIQGVQSQGVGTSLKHFAVNNQETDRMRIDVQVDERALREIYLPAFERAVATAQPASVMCSYNGINGVPASQNSWLLGDVLRGEWGFEGAVISDWGAVGDRVAALEAGLDLDMPGGGNPAASILAAIDSGTLAERDVNRSVDRIRRLAERTAAAREEAPEVDLAAHHGLARRAAEAGIVLLRNEREALPLSGRGAVAVIGALAEHPRIQGGGSSHVVTTHLDIPLDELSDRLGAERIRYAPGYALGDEVLDESLLDAAVAEARGAECAVVFVGLQDAQDSEGWDRSSIELPDDHVRLIQEVAAAAVRTVVVLVNGGVVSLEPWHDDVDAIVEGWLLGQGGGAAIAAVLTGEVNPSGRLTETIPFRLEDTPAFINFPGELGRVQYGEGVFVGYRYYETAHTAVRYPFGHGLSYSTFEYGEPTVTVLGEASAILEMTVTNTGSRAGADVVQIYVGAPGGPVRQPRRELRSFRKVHLAAGESSIVTFELDRRAFAYWHVVDRRWAVMPGEYSIEVGRSVRDISKVVSVALSGDANRIAPLTLDSTVGDWLAHPEVGPRLLSLITPSKDLDSASEEGDISMASSMPMRRMLNFGLPGLNRDVAETLAASTRVGLL